MATASTATDNGMRGFQQLVVDAVELAGSISPPLKARLVFYAALCTARLSSHSR